MMASVVIQYTLMYPQYVRVQIADRLSALVVAWAQTNPTRRDDGREERKSGSAGQGREGRSGREPIGSLKQTNHASKYFPESNRTDSPISCWRPPAPSCRNAVYGDEELVPGSAPSSILAVARLWRTNKIRMSISFY